MRGRDGESTNRPEPAGPTDERFVYHLTDEGRKALEELERATGVAAHQKAARVEAIAPELAREERRERRRSRARSARARGRRFGTVCGRWRGQGDVPDLRMSGAWLRGAGFERGREFEVAVAEGRLTIEAL